LTDAGHIHDLFHAIEKYSPFHDFLVSDDEFVARLKAEQEAAQPQNPSPSSGIRVVCFFSMGYVSFTMISTLFLRETCV
jgi:hypothetical protein